MRRDGEGFTKLVKVTLEDARWSDSLASSPLSFALLHLAVPSWTDPQPMQLWRTPLDPPSSDSV